MRLTELEFTMATLPVPKDAYSLVGGLPNEAYCIERIDSSWRVYYSERGNRSSLRSFDSEEEACEYFYNWLKKTFRFA